MLSSPGGKRSNLYEALNEAELRVFIKDVRDKNGRKRPINVRSWSTVKDVKDQLYQLLNIPPSNQRLFFGPTNDLPNHRTLNDAGIYKSGETLLFDIRPPAGGLTSKTSLHRSNSTSDLCVSSVLYDLTNRTMRRLVQQVRRGFDLGLKPEMALDGSGGTYFLKDARKMKIAAFKPADEEPYAINNPRGYIRGGLNSVDAMRAGINPGDSCLREVAAFLIDHGNFCSVPMTTLVEARHQAFHNNGSHLKVYQGGASVGTHSLSMVSSYSHSDLQNKIGSCQEFIDAECTMDDLSYSMIGVDEVHKIAILDIRLMNADRNSANLLCRKVQGSDKKMQYKLIPIDHGYSLRSACDVCWFDWCWLDWPQLKEPLSRKSRSYILNLDIEGDARLLKERLHIPSEAIDIFRASSKLLQAGVRAGLTLYDIALMCCRHDNAGEIPSKLEAMIKSAGDLSKSAVQNERWHHSAASNALADQLSTKSPMSTRKSSATLVSLENYVNVDVLDDKEASRTEARPALEGTSCSDSSDSGDKDFEEEECEEWAKLLVLDKVGIEEKTFIPPEKTRSILTRNSYSTDSLSTSPAGFWHLHPEDIGSTSNVEWDAIPSPPSSPPKNATTKVPTPFSKGGIGEAFGSDRTFIPEANLVGLNDKPKRMIRSQSYSAFSFDAMQVNNSKLSSKANTSGILENDQYGAYLTKFVDLLIVRETMSVARSKSNVLLY